MFREKLFIRHMHRFHISKIFIEGSWFIGINCIIFHKIRGIIYFFDIHTVILPSIFLIKLLKLHDTNIVSLLNLFKKRIIISRASIQVPDLFLGESMGFVFRVNDDISTFFKNLLLNLVVSVIDCLFFLFLLPKTKTNDIWSRNIIKGIVIVRAWLHLTKFEWFWC